MKSSIYSFESGASAQPAEGKQPHLQPESRIPNKQSGSLQRTVAARYHHVQTGVVVVGTPGQKQRADIDPGKASGAFAGA
jgi:hypothetical protein